MGDTAPLGCRAGAATKTGRNEKMTRNLKAFGLALVAVFALSAVAASGASATDHTFTSTSGNGLTDLTGETEEGVEPVLSAAGAEVVCEHGTYAGTVEGNDVGEVTVHPEYHGNCRIPTISEEVDVNTDGCDYRLTGKTHETVENEETEELETKAGEHATVYVECTEGHDITIHDTTFGIVMHIGAQGPLVGAHYTNLNTSTEVDNENPAEVTVDATVEGITTTCTDTKGTPEGGFCFLLENGGTDHNASYEDKVIVKGYEDEGLFSKDGTTHVWSGTHGDQVHIGVNPGT
jgi:hypothetical protein